jgi:hypothetical protein
LPILFLGSKSDLIQEICIKDDYIKDFKEKFNLYDYLPISSKTGENIQLSFESLTKEILKRIK